ncbi:MAG: DUF192 domain-containing protein [Bacteroidota bacterium]|nr:DUF192 domain-containing protein [Bacteroidota bacterium]
MIRKSLSVLALTFLIGMNSCENTDKDSHTVTTEPITFSKEGSLYLIRKEGDTLPKLAIEFAETDYEHQTGLMYRKSMEKLQGMLFVYEDSRPRNFYMKNTYIPLDILYFGEDSTLVSIQKDAKPLDETSLPSEGPAQFILEINAGLSEEWELDQGDRIYFYKNE